MEKSIVSLSLWYVVWLVAICDSNQNVSSSRLGVKKRIFFNNLVVSSSVIENLFVFKNVIAMNYVNGLKSVGASDEQGEEIDQLLLGIYNNMSQGLLK